MKGGGNNREAKTMPHPAMLCKGYIDEGNTSLLMMQPNYKATENSSNMCYEPL